MTVVLPSPCSSAPEQPPGQRGGLSPVCRPVSGAAEREEHHRIRRAVFVREQGLFGADDVDGHDGDPATVHVLGLVDGLPAGTVRLYPLDRAGLWKGDRLAVLPEHRRAQIGRPLVRTAVALAAARGGTEMVASVQVANTRFFLALGWTAVGEPVDLHGHPHQPMSIALTP